MPRRLMVLLLAALAAALTASALAGCSSGSDDDTSTTTTSPVDSQGTEPATDPDDEREAVTIENGIRIEVLSSQPDRATGPDARVRITPQPGGSPSDLTVTLQEGDVTAQLREVDGSLEGVVVGLIEGNNTLRVSSSKDPTAVATQRIRSWPLSGPMISGPQRPLFGCTTEQAGLGKATDLNCSAPTRVRWSYVNTAGVVAELSDGAARPGGPPEDVATVSIDTIDGQRDIPFVLRHETGVLNRSVYDIVTIDPSPTGSDEDHSDAGWNGRLLYRFGDGCGSTHGQGISSPAMTDVDLLSRGYALATATFNTGSVQCNDVISAETAMMVKERFIEVFGEPLFTIGEGSGGGAVQVHLITQNYLGLLDGGVVSEGFPDWVTVMNGVTDCALLQRWYETPTGAVLTPRQRAAVNGHASDATCANWDTELGAVLDPTQGCDPGVPAEQIYDATTNPGGLRCTYFDEAINVFGADLVTGHANRPLDNVGVQYGLGALNESLITFAQFIDLNTNIGGYDADGQPVPARHEVDFETAALTYETGRVSAGVGDQNKVPIIEIDAWGDPDGDIHDRVRPFSLRDRLTLGRSNNAAPGLQIWTRDPALGPPEETAPVERVATLEALDTLDAWLTAIRDDTEDRAERLVRTRPVAALDNCTLPARSEPLSGLHIYEEGQPCADRYPVAGDPRIAAGAPRSNDIIKCNLKPVDPADYEEPITQRQYEQLVGVFPMGVCDWTTVGVGQTAPSLSDRSYEDVTSPEQLA